MADNYQVLPVGFGSYLEGIIPHDQAIAAGAFSTAMGQIRNISSVDIQRFAQITYSLETTAGLPNVNGTDVPVDASLATDCTDKIALGSGVNGTYTNSDFFGCMTGLPYPVSDIQASIEQLQTQKLENIYHELYLAVTWEQAVLTPVVTQISPGNWQVTGVTITNPGGGYGRGSAPPPTITINYGATAICTIGTDPTDIDNFGRITSVTVTAPGSHGNSSFTLTVQAPPTATLPIAIDGSISTSGINTASGTVGWTSPMDAVVQAYITQANDEIANIQLTANQEAVTALNGNWNASGLALRNEQRARYIAIDPVPIPRDSRLSPYPSSLYAFVDSMSTFAADTAPHGAAQSLENISDPCTTGGQSLVAMMRQERNQVRLQEIGIGLDNNIPSNINSVVEKTLLLNGTVPNAVAGLTTAAGETYTLPAYSKPVLCDGTSIAPEPVFYYDPELPGVRYGDGNQPGNINAINNPVVIINTNVPISGGDPQIPDGILSPTPNVLPAKLDTAYSSSTLAPSTFSTKDAIDHVIACNCDCWVN